MKMRKRVGKKAISVIGIMFLMLLLSVMSAPAPAFGGEKIIDLPIENKVTAMDRNGNEYTRLIVTASRSLQGVDYTVGVPAMAFGNVNDSVKDLEIGDNLKAIVSERVFNGRSSMTIIKLLE